MSNHLFSSKITQRTRYDLRIQTVTQLRNYRLVASVPLIFQHSHFLTHFYWYNNNKNNGENNIVYYSLIEHQCPKVLIVQRNNIRIIRNEKQLVALVKVILGPNSTVTLIDYSEMSMAEQIRLTYKADILILVHGAGLGNALFLPAHAVIMDIYPYSLTSQLTGIVNWMRYSLQDVKLSHSPFDVIEPSHMQYIHGEPSKRLEINPNGMTKGSVTYKSLPVCFCNNATRKDWFRCAFLTLFRCVKFVEVNLPRFQIQFEKVVNDWKSGSSYIAPISKVVYKNQFKNLTEPWYYANMRITNTSNGVDPPNCATYHRRICWVNVSLYCKFVLLDVDLSFIYFIQNSAILHKENLLFFISFQITIIVFVAFLLFGIVRSV